jgi:hypothetical protein
MSIIEAVRGYLETCPLLTGGLLHVDWLPEEAATYSVDVIPVTPVVKRYIDGSSLRQFAFVLATRTYYGEFVRQQLDNLGFFEDFAQWLEAQSRAHNFPDLGAGRIGRTVEVTTSGYVFAPDTETARYQIQCRLTYLQENNFDNEVKENA